MTLFEDEFVRDQDDHVQTGENNKPNAYHVDDKAVNETSPKKAGEGTPAGGQNFGKNNLTPSGDDKNNPSRNAGYTNAYFRRTEPSEEHTENINFKPVQQEGQPDYDSAQPYSKINVEMPKPEKIERGNGENDRPHKGNTYQEGTVDDDGNSEPNIPGPGELPDQQKVGEPDAGNNAERDHIET